MKARIYNRSWIAAGAVVGALALAGCSGDSGTTSTPPATTSALPAAGPAPANPAMGAGPQPAATAVANAGIPPVHRPDPFRPWWNTTPPPPPVISFTQPVRIAMGGTARPEVQPNIEVREVPTRRVAGILSGQGVYALIDGGPGDQTVVKPGDQLGEYRVESINSDSVVLKKTVKIGANTQVFTQVVPLTDVGSSAQFGGPGGAPGGGMPGGVFGPGAAGMGAGAGPGGGLGPPGGIGRRGRGFEE